jgi:hypothetical protein
MKTMIDFHKALLAMRMPWPVWIAVMAGVNMIGAIVFFDTLEGKLVLASVVAGFFLQTAIYRRLGFVRLLGAGHVFWLALVPWLATRLAEVGLTSAFGYWIAAVVVIDGISLVIDAADVARYLRGERSPTVPEISGKRLATRSK